MFAQVGHFRVGWLNLTCAKRACIMQHNSAEGMHHAAQFMKRHQCAPEWGFLHHLTPWCAWPHSACVLILNHDSVLLAGEHSLCLCARAVFPNSDHTFTSFLLCACAVSPQITAAKAQGKAMYDGTKADVWAMGVLLCVMLIGKFPFEGDSVSTMGVGDPMKKVRVMA